MGIQDRDHWKQQHNKKHKYKEKTDFRISAYEYKRKKYRRAWAQNFKKWGLVLLAVLIVGQLLKWLLR